MKLWTRLAATLAAVVAVAGSVPNFAETLVSNSSNLVLFQYDDGLLGQTVRFQNKLRGKCLNVPGGSKRKSFP
jgi:hypothetical protein